jgi:hypothetical protein
LHIIRAEPASTLGLSRDAVAKARVRAPASQSRLRDIADFRTQVLPWAEVPKQTFTWYRSPPLRPAIKPLRPW